MYLDFTIGLESEDVTHGAIIVFFLSKFSHKQWVYIAVQSFIMGSLGRFCFWKRYLWKGDFFCGFGGIIHFRI